MTRLWLLGGTHFGLTMLALSLHVPGALGLGSLTLKSWFVAITGISAAVYVLAVMLVTHHPGLRHGVWVVVLVAAGLRAPLIVSPPFLSTDVYRYIWDGRVQALGLNPYRYLPADPALASLRDDTVYPRINRAGYAPTIYPPAAQVLFGVVGFVWSSITAIKLAMAGFEVLTVYCLWQLLAVARLPTERVLIYAWNPLPVWAFASDGHIDAAVAGLLAATLLLRARRRDAWAGITLGLMILVKFLPVVVAPVLWRRRAGWRAAAAAVVTMAVLYGAYSSVGIRVFGFLSGYGLEEGYDTGDGFWLLAGVARVVPLPVSAAIVYKIAAGLVLAGCGAWLAFVRRPDDPVAVCSAAGIMMALLTCAISPHYPWYFAWLAVPCVLAPSPAVLWLATAPMLLYLDTFGDRLIWPSVIYVPAIGFALASLRRASANGAIKGVT